MTADASLAMPLAGTHLIEAGAGTGKTYRMTLLVLRLLLEQALPLSRILLVTFTEAATAELKEKVRARLLQALRALETGTCDDDNLAGILANAPPDGAARIASALSTFDEASIFTIHGFCHRVLREYAFECGTNPEREVVTDSGIWFRRQTSNWWVSHMMHRPPFLVRWLIGQSFKPKTLMNLAARLCACPDMPVSLPPLKGGGAAAFVEAFGRARRIWQSDAPDIKSLLLGCDALNGTSYRKEKFSGWLDELDRYFAGEEPPRVNDDVKSALMKFCQDALQQGTKKNRETPVHPFFDALTALRSAVDGLRDELISSTSSFVDHVQQHLPQQKEKDGVLFYDDMLVLLDRALRADDGRLLTLLTKRWHAALVDEFQDTDFLQYRIFEQIFARSGLPLFMVGDPKQSIYAFRGADIFTYMGAAATARHRASLTVNHRSDPGLVAGVNGLFTAVPHPFVFEDIAFAPATPAPGRTNMLQENGQPAPPLQFIFIPRTEETVTERNKKTPVCQRSLKVTSPRILELIVDDIIALLNGPTTLNGAAIRPGDVAVLVNSNDQAALVAAALAERGVSAVVSERASVYGTPASTEMHQILHAVRSPEYRPFLAAALSTRLIDLPRAILAALEEDADLCGRWQSVFVGLRETFLRRGFAAMMEELFHLPVEGSSSGLRQRLLSRPDGERYLTDFLHVAELLQTRCGGRRLGLHQLVADLNEAMTNSPDRVLGDAPVRIDNDVSSVQVSTIHKSKGLQYPVVYLPFSCRNGNENHPLYSIWHDPDNDFAPCCALLNEDDRITRIVERENEAETVRRLYVSLTRAKHLCKVVFGAFDSFFTSPFGKMFRAANGMRPLVHDDGTCVEDDVLRAAVDDFSRATGGAAGLSAPAPEGAMFNRVAVDEPERPAVARSFHGPVPDPLRAMSFSGLVRHAAQTDDTDDGPDAMPGDETISLPATAPQGWGALEAGADFGTFVHDIYEHANFSDATGQSLSAAVTRSLSRHGYADHIEAEVMAALIAQTLRTPLTPATFCLADIHPSQRFAEVAFDMAVQGAHPLSPDRLRDALSEGADGSFARWVDSVARLGFPGARGFLRGFIDLVFTVDGRWYIADYKSNRLGDGPDAYGTAALLPDMALHHYYLQYHIYLTALHRWLALWQKDYDYDTHFGGAFYLYVRGMDGSGNGIFFDRPPRSRMEALAELLCVAKEAP